MIATIIALAVLVICLVLGVPIYASLLLSGASGLLLLDGVDVTIGALGAVPFQSISQQSLLVVPMYILMGTFVYHSGATDDFFDFIRRLTRRLPGGMGIATILTGGGLAAVTGSSVASSALITRIAFKDLIKAGFDRRFTAGMIAAVGTLGVLIPPSIMLVVYGIAAQVSVRSLLIAGILPGLVTIAALSSVVWVHQFRKDRKRSVVSTQVVSMAGEPPDANIDHAHLSSANSDNTDPEDPQRSIASLAPSVIMISSIFIIAIGGLGLGIFTTIESGAVGVLLSFLILLFFSRRSFSQLIQRSKHGIREALDITGMIFLLYIGASVFGYFLTSSGLPAKLVRLIVSSNHSAPAWLTVLLMVLLLIPLGMFLDGITIILVMVPLMYPVVQGLGMNGVWFGIVMVKLIEIGLITPPVGLNAYVVAGSEPSVTPEDVFIGVKPFLAVEILVTGIIFAFPVIVTLLPGLMP